MTIESLLKRAQQAQEQGEYTNAERLYVQLLNNGFQPEAMLNALVRVCLLAHSYVRAAEYLVQLGSIFPNKIAYCEALANLHVRAKNWAAAADCYAKFIVHNPAHADAHYNHAYHLKQAAKYPEAIVSYQAALHNFVSQPEEVLTNMAVIYSENLRLESKAKESLEHALAAAPNYIPALFNLATLYEEESEKDKAAEYYQSILSIEPNNHSALMRLAASQSVYDPNAAIISQIRSALSERQIDNAARVSLNFSLGKLLDDCGQYDQAFKCYADANRLDHAVNPKYSREKQQELVHDNIAFFTEQWFSRLTPVSDAEPIFICGMFRSGSTLVEQVLASHSRVTAGGERDFFLKLDSKVIQHYPSGIDGLASSDLHAIADEYLSELRRAFPAATCITDKRPENFLYIGIIKALFPNAKIIHTKRQQLDNSLSIYFLRASAAVKYASDLGDIAHYYTQYMRLMAHWKSLFADDIYELNYDSLVAHPEPEVRALLSFLGFSWEPACLEFHRTENRVKTASLWQVRQPLYQKSSGRWRNYEKNISDLIKAFEE